MTAHKPREEKIVWSHPVNLPEVEILSAENSQRAWCVYHQTYAICTINTIVADPGGNGHGLYEWVYRGKQHSSPEHSLMLVEPGEIHRTTKISPTRSFDVVLIDPKFIAKLALEAGMNPRPHFRQAATTDPILFQAFHRFHSAVAAGSTHLHLQSLLLNCIACLFVGHSETNLRLPRHQSSAPLRRTRDYIRQSYAERISLERLAEIAGLSRFHFLRSFTKEFGLPPHAYQVQLRVEKARHLLKTGVPVHAIKAGFADQSHLTRHFKKVYGVTPARYASMVGIP
jgi:AraC-like DNA-binding protein